jgi:CheY-like chemotaxis protein
MDREMTGGGTDALETREHGAALRVLIVDDEPLIGTTLKVLLADDHDVEFASSGKSARALLEADQGYDVILCDLMMPGVSGMDLFAWLKNASPQLSSKMVFMTGGVFTDEARTFLDSVPNVRIEKPFEHGLLLQILRDLDPSS